MAVNDRIADYRFCLSQIASDDIEISVDGVGKQHHGKRQLCQKAQSVAAYIDAQQAQPMEPGDKAETVNTTGPLIKDRSIRATAIDQKKSHEESGILVHSGQIFQEK